MNTCYQLARIHKAPKWSQRRKNNGRRTSLRKCRSCLWNFLTYGSWNMQTCLGCTGRGSQRSGRELESASASPSYSFCLGSSKQGENEDLVQMQFHSNEVWTPTNVSSGLAALIPNSKSRSVPASSVLLASLACRWKRLVHTRSKRPVLFHNERQIRS